MNLNGDEKRIRQLFRDLSLDEQRQAPQFVSVLARANSRASRARDRVWSWRLVTAVVMIFAALLIALIVIVRKPQDSTGDANQAATPLVAPEKQTGVAPLQPRAPSGNPHRTTIRRARYRRPSNDGAFATTSLFAWKSPTASLLQTPGDELL